ncbi:hypothetical protein GCM10011494_08380 [Novosphingobium endophyticum]|uniref:DUF4398 domain-containing protein n=1 Tax=Novosphingobium endophyticum TaxID=1955250 RepID=A0A916X4D2_9SPHN|nr:hypothetical protein [Novosphingobium endophyticum]GGB92341.1 hypothetical protein GCM10011494_08380 [Novosphingobium endophyticum]
MNRATARLLLVLAPLALAACSSTDGYPSLAPRAGERIAGSAKPVPGAEQAEAPPLPPPSADLVARLGGLVSAAQEADRRFQARQAEAASMVARADGSATASDQWASAQIALGKLETSRSAAVAALAELDGLYADARVSAPVEVSPAAEAIAEARARVSDLVARENAVIAGLSARLAS